MTQLTEIERLLEEQVRPQLALHQGNLSIISLTDDVLTIRLLGACANCPSASLTTEELIASAVQSRFPQIRRVVLDTGVSDCLLTQAREFLTSRHTGAKNQQGVT
ncbi:NifU family protein [Faecalispora jeddahensis]|uniref:NifU family protein n=1 Tax=Faecalispora jeddahensis TaxID=1414721 RepID=UPI00189866A1|nr:NifU family protein [Faecalispora jeddahensis]